jgi:hypothetical protein
MEEGRVVELLRRDEGNLDIVEPNSFGNWIGVVRIVAKFDIWPMLIEESSGLIGDEVDEELIFWDFGHRIWG